MKSYLSFGVFVKKFCPHDCKYINHVPSEQFNKLHDAYVIDERLALRLSIVRVYLSISFIRSVKAKHVSASDLKTIKKF
jgi:hypothetical protein